MAQATYGRLRARPAPALPVAQMVLGQTPQQAADLLPRLFNLCRVAQGVAARAAFGLPLDPDWQDALRAEIIREHVVKLCLKWPAVMTVQGLPLPLGWESGTQAARTAVFGPSGRVPQTGQALESFMASGAGIAPVLAAIAQAFAPGIGTRPALPFTTFQTAPAQGAQENSPAARQAGHPAMRYAQQTWGRGPLWSALGVACDLEALWNGHLPAADLRPGRAIVPAARGLYTVTARVETGRITGFDRVTPTDHLLAPQGALAQSLATLPDHKSQTRAAQLLSILDPCHPVTLERITEEAAHA